jgi:hypothetical protein
MFPKPAKGSQKTERERRKRATLAWRSHQRKLVLMRAGGRCEACHEPERWDDKLEVHHVEERGMGGRHGAALLENESLDNLRAVHASCHRLAHGV